MSTLSGGKVCGEVRMRVEEFWDLPVQAGRSCFYTVECGNDCFYRSGCFQTEQLAEYESPVTVASSVQEEGLEPASASIEWRDKQGTIRFFLRGRVSQGVRLQVWQLPKDVMTWRSDSSGHGLLDKDDVFRGVPPGSVRVCGVSFPADSLRLSKGEYAGWLALYPQGCVYLRLLQRRKVGAVELLRLNLMGASLPTTVKMNSTRAGDFGRQVTRSGSQYLGRGQSSMVLTGSSPWRDVAGTGFTAESIDYLVDGIAKLDRQLAEPFSTRLLGGLVPASLARILALAVLAGSVVVVRDLSLFSQVVAVTNLFMVFLLSVAAVLPAERTGSCSEVETEPYGEVIAQRRRPRPLAKALAVDAQMVTSARGGLAVSGLMVLAVALQTLLDATRTLRSPRSSWRSFAALVLVWSVPWTLPKVWRVAVRVAFVLLVGGLTRYAPFQRLLANTLGAVLVLTGRQRQSVVAPLHWVTRNIPQGWKARPGEDHDFESDDVHM